MTVLIFILHHFQEKRMTMFQTLSRNPYFGAILSLFGQNFVENEFFGKKGLCHFLNISVIYHLAKKSQKTNHPLLRRTPYRQFDRSLTVQTVRAFPKLLGWNWFQNHFQFITQGLLLFFILFLFVKIYREAVETSADLNLLFFLNLTKNLLQEFGIVKLVTFRMHAMRVITIFNFWY